MPMIGRSLFGALLFGFACTPALNAQDTAAPSDLDTVVAEQGDQRLTLGELDAAVRRIPAEARVGYFDDPDRAARLITSLLRTKQLADKAREQGWHEKPEVVADLAMLEAEKLAESFVKGEAKAGVNIEALTALAREQYDNDPSVHATPREIDLWHFLVVVKDEEEKAVALALAQQIRSELNEGVDADMLLARLKKEHAGELVGSPIKNVDLNKMEPEIAAVVAANLEQGRVTEPVLSRHGYHVIRVARFMPARVPPFEEVREKLVGALEKDARIRAEQAVVAANTSGDVRINEQVVPLFFERYGTYRTELQEAGQ